MNFRNAFDEEIQTLLRLGIIESSYSSYSSPVIMVQKDNHSAYRMVIDFRKINSYIIFDAEQSCNEEEDLHLFYGANYFS